MHEGYTTCGSDLEKNIYLHAVFRPSCKAMAAEDPLGRG